MQEMLTVITAWVLLFVAWILVINSKPNRTEVTSKLASEGMPVDISDPMGDAYIIDSRTVALTDPMVNKPRQYGYVELKGLSEVHKCQFEIMLDRNLFSGNTQNQMVWFSMDGVAWMESASTSLPIIDRGIRVIMTQFESAQLNTFSIGMLSDSSKDIRGTALKPLDKSVWIPCIVAINLPAGRVTMQVGNYTEVFDLPKNFSFTGNAYIGAKTTTNSGIRIRNLTKTSF